jgi:hypothetical protein
MLRSSNLAWLAWRIMAPLSITLPRARGLEPAKPFDPNRSLLSRLVRKQLVEQKKPPDRVPNSPVPNKIVCQPKLSCPEQNLIP